ncbi:MAG TPA: integrase core domain-containing protein [Vicinamibacterales bacterium]|nr:integrase core domain-containing protein [Vicinamibacterales bacterium]
MAVTRTPTQQWTAQQLRNATLFGQGPQVIVRDRDDKFGAVFDRVARGAAIRIVRSAVRTPLMNSVCERFLGSVRRECMDHFIILSQPQLKYLLAEYALGYFNTARSHQGIGLRIPVATERSYAKFAGSGHLDPGARRASS